MTHAHIHEMVWTLMLILCYLRGLQSTSKTCVCEERPNGTTQPEFECYRPPEGQPKSCYDEWQENSCLLYPSGVLNCSWSFDFFPGSQSSASVTVCKNGQCITSWNCLTEEDAAAERTTAQCQGVVGLDMTAVVLHSNISKPDMWKSYSFKKEFADIEVLLPPPNISAIFRGRDLLVSWSIPRSRSNSRSYCFAYLININGKHVEIKEAKEEFMERNADPTLTYKVKLKTKKNNKCVGIEQPSWSDWSHTITVEPMQSAHQLNILVIVSISLGVPMVLLTLLLLLRPQRVSKLLFPPIPQPPLKYAHFLEKQEAFNFAPFFPTPLSTEEFTEVATVETIPQKD